MKKTIFITGVGSGIGLSTAALFARSGWNVVGTVRRYDDPHPLAGVQAPLQPVLRHFRMIVLPKCGHTPWAERDAREAFFAALREELPGRT
jgi:NAD(P)-dependent dehydrogenase (short-subunit alcohol dehydrogenase family)